MDKIIIAVYNLRDLKRKRAILEERINDMNAELEKVYNEINCARVEHTNLLENFINTNK